MSARTIVISLAVHAVLGALLLAVDGQPRQRLATVIQLVESAPAPTPTPETPPPAPEPTPAPAPEAKKPPEKPPASKPPPKRKRPKPAKAKPRTKTADAQPKGNPNGDGNPRAPFFSGLVLGNADGPGIDMGVAEDIERAPRDGNGPAGQGRGGGGGGEQAPASAQPVVRRPSAPCTDKQRPSVQDRRQRIPYPSQARAAGAQGRLVLKLHIDAAGTIKRVELVSGVHPDIDRQAINAVRSWKMTPAMHCGRPVASTYTLARRFELTD